MTAVNYFDRHTLDITLIQTGVELALSDTHWAFCRIYEAASAGLGFAIANCAYMMGDVQAGRLLAPFHDNLISGCGWYLVYPKLHAEFGKVRNFEQWIVKQAKASQVLCDEVFARCDR